MRSQLVFLIIQSIHFCAMTSRKTHVDFETSSKFSGWRQIINEMSVPKKLLFLFPRCLYLLCGSIHQGLDPMRFSDEARGRPEIYIVWLIKNC